MLVGGGPRWCFEVPLRQGSFRSWSQYLRVLAPSQVQDLFNRIMTLEIHPWTLNLKITQHCKENPHLNQPTFILGGFHITFPGCILDNPPVVIFWKDLKGPKVIESTVILLFQICRWLKSPSTDAKQMVQRTGFQGRPPDQPQKSWFN